MITVPDYSRSRLARMLSPKSIAVIGGRWAAEAARQCLRANFTGELWRVNRRADADHEIPGVACFASIADLPTPPDAAFIAVNRHETLDMVQALEQSGAGGAVCFASGFSETGDNTMQRQLLQSAGEMPFLGPNCYGYLNYLDGALLWPDQHGGGRVEKGVAILSQSGNIAINVTMQQRGLPLAFVAALGNQAQLGFVELSETLLADDRITAIGWIIEGSADAAGLERVFRAAHGKKPIVALKLGTSQQGAAAALSHTASLAGDNEAVNALLRRYGVARAHTLPAFLETLKLLHFNGPLGGRNIVSLSCSGGEAVLVADSVAGRRLRLRPFTDNQRAHIKELMGELIVAENPFDYHTFIWGDRQKKETVFTVALDGNTDMGILVLDFPREDVCEVGDWWLAVEAFAAARTNAGGVPAAVVATLPECLSERMAHDIAAAGVLPLYGIIETIDAVEAAADIGESWRQPLPPPLLPRRHSPALLRTLDEYEAKARLQAAGIVVPAGRQVADADAAITAANTLGYPVAVKALGLAHKSEHGGIRLNCTDADAVRYAVQDMQQLAAAFLVETMEADIVAELLVGIRRDMLTGLTLTLGSGGVWTEVLADTVTILLPADAAAIGAALGSLRAAPLWRGYRGGVAGDEAGAVNTILKLAAFAERHAETLVELEVNPLLMKVTGAAIPADVLLVESPVVNL